MQDTFPVADFHIEQQAREMDQEEYRKEFGVEPPPMSPKSRLESQRTLRTVSSRSGSMDDDEDKDNASSPSSAAVSSSPEASPSRRIKKAHRGITRGPKKVPLALMGYVQLVYLLSNSLCHGCVDGHIGLLRLRCFLLTGDCSTKSSAPYAFDHGIQGANRHYSKLTFASALGTNYA